MSNATVHEQDASTLYTNGGKAHPQKLCNDGHSLTFHTWLMCGYILQVQLQPLTPTKNQPLASPSQRGGSIHRWL